MTILFSDRGTPVGYRHMNGYGSHTYRWVNEKGEAFWVKFHFKTNSGVKNFTAEEANALKSENPDFATQDLYERIHEGKDVSWKFCV